mmetsp:Transcript_46587/g.56393  ORF Transcript_46587/g.56393 Transcript_46587/m.56393 type:complete len:147 (+) Transcript_46587:771-1211(+)
MCMVVDVTFVKFCEEAYWIEDTEEAYWDNDFADEDSTVITAAVWDDDDAMNADVMMNYAAAPVHDNDDNADHDDDDADDDDHHKHDEDDSNHDAENDHDHDDDDDNDDNDAGDDDADDNGNDADEIESVVEQCYLGAVNAVALELI